MQDLGVLPVRQITSLDEMQQVFKDLKTILVDASERPYLRSAAALEQAADYSGKKRHTRKNTLISSRDRYIYYLGQTVCGSTHHYQLLKSEFDPAGTVSI